jgi:glycosidase
MKKLKFLALFLAAIFLLSACQDGRQKDQQSSEAQYISNAPVPEWSKDAVIYEVNIRQYTEEGTFNAFSSHLPRLKELGVDILWLMPVHPIGEKNRKGTLGSYYSIKDYKAINPEFGTFEDFKSLVDKVHEMDMHLVLDWVANHTAWDHPWISEHPEWYTTNDEGEIMAPEPDWSDVADLNYDNQELREAMTEALKFWVREADIDGYRCDVAGKVPVDFWETAREELEKIKPVWMLAEDEAETELLEYAFNANYGWEFHHIMNALAKGEKNALDVAQYFQKTDTLYPHGAYPMQFTSNHDENSWNGTVFDRLDDAVKTMAALTFTVEGMPLIYSGQEAGLSKSLAFFEKDRIEWKESEMTPFYQTLTALKANNPALWNGTASGEMKILKTNSPETLFAFSREKENNQIVAVFNFSDSSESVFMVEGPEGTFTELFSGKEVTLPAKGVLLQPWDFRIYTQR